MGSEKRLPMAGSFLHETFKLMYIYKFVDR